MKTMCKSTWIISPSWAKRQNDWNHHLVLDWYGKSLWKFWESHISIMFLPYANTTSSTDVKLKTHQKLEDDDRWANAGITGLENQRGNRRLAVDNWETCWGWRHLTWNRLKGYLKTIPQKKRRISGCIFVWREFTFSRTEFGKKDSIIQKALETIASYELSMHQARKEKRCQREIKLREYHYVSSSIRIIHEERATWVTQNGWWTFRHSTHWNLCKKLNLN